MLATSLIHTIMLDFIVTLVLASIIMATLMCVTVAVTMPFHGALVRLRANYNPRAVGLEGIENRVGPTLTSLIGTLQRTKRLEGWYGLYKGMYRFYDDTNDRHLSHAGVHDDHQYLLDHFRRWQLDQGT